MLGSFVPSLSSSPFPLHLSASYERGLTVDILGDGTRGGSNGSMNDQLSWLSQSWRQRVQSVVHTYLQTNLDISVGLACTLAK